MNKLTSYPFNKRNPFEKQKEFKMVSGTVCSLDIEKSDDEIIIVQGVECRVSHIPRIQFITVKKVGETELKKIFLNSIRHIYHLKPVTVKILDYIIHELKPDSSGFQLRVHTCIREMGCSQASVFRALGELCGADIIARGCSETHYFINPVFVNYGTSISFADSFVTDSEKKKDIKRMLGTKEIKK